MKRNTMEWKEKRAKFLKGKTCEWCGSSDSLCVHIPRYFSTSQVSSEIYSAAYTRFREVYSKGTGNSILSLPANTVTKAIRPGIKLQLCMKPNLTIRT